LRRRAIGKLQTQVRQRLERSDDEHKTPWVVDDVLHDEGRERTDPEGFAFGREVAERLPELWVDLETGVNLSDGSRDGLAEPESVRPRQQCL
jgi:hypothetical protein